MVVRYEEGASRAYAPSPAQVSHVRKWLIRVMFVGALMHQGLTMHEKNSLYVHDQARFEGEVVEFGRSGYVWGTYEGTLRTPQGLVEFSLDSERRNGEALEQLATALSTARDERRTVEIETLHQSYTWPWRSTSGRHVQSVSPK